MESRVNKFSSSRHCTRIPGVSSGGQTETPWCLTSWQEYDNVVCFLRSFLVIIDFAMRTNNDHSSIWRQIETRQADWRGLCGRLSFSATYTIVYKTWQPSCTIKLQGWVYASAVRRQRNYSVALQRSPPVTVGQQTLECAENFPYLGSYISLTDGREMT